jgi:DnaK suppressor protein
MKETKKTIVNDLDQDTINQIKKELTLKKAEIIKDLGSIEQDNDGSNSDHRVKFPNYGTKSDENAQEVGEYTTNLATEKILESTLRDIEGALSRIEKGSYGICKYCSQPIGKKRMQARPVASACIACRTKLQKAM